MGEALSDPQIALILDEIDRDRWFADVSTLAAWNRWTRGTQVLSARDWLVAQFAALDGFSVTTSDFWVPPSSYPGAWAYNVIATLPGTVRPDEWYVVGGHYDSTSGNPAAAAPGADDNASGCAGTLELARLFAAHPPDATMIFVCFSGEEQGLYGSEDYVADLVAAGDLARVQGVYVLDMIAFTAGLQLDCILETESFAQTWLDHFADAAADFTTLGIVMEYGVCCSDHAPFLQLPVNQRRPAVLAIEADYPSNPNYHTVERPAGLPQPTAGGADPAHGRRRAPAARGLLGTLRRRFRVGGYAALERDRALNGLPSRGSRFTGGCRRRLVAGAIRVAPRSRVRCCRARDRRRRCRNRSSSSRWCSR